MKLKGVGFFEAHVEKLLLGLMVAVAAGVVVLQFATSPNAVSVRNQTLPPERAYDPVERRAQEVEAQMSAANPTIPPTDGRTDALAGLEGRVRAPAAPRPEIIALGSPAQIDEALLTNTAEDVEYAFSAPPAPSKPVVASYAATLDPALLAETPELPRNEELAAIVGPSQPYDIATVSVEVIYDGTALEEQFRSNGPGEQRALPFNWFRSVEALGLQLERQERQADGSWSQPAVINGLPGVKTEYQYLQEDAAAGALGRDALASAARTAFEYAIDYRRPEPLRTIAGPQWKPPTVAQQELASQGGADKRTQADQINRQLAQLRRDEEANESQLKESPGEQEQRDPRGPRNPGRGDPQGEQPVDRQQQRLQQRLEQITQRIAQLEADMRALGYDPDTGAPMAVAGFEDTTEDLRLLEDSQARLWAHDATAQPGKTYRYRTRLAINNPMYGREPVLVEAQRPLAASPVVFSEPSEWSDPVVVAPRTAFFLTSAQDGRGGALGPSEPSASVEVYSFYYGYYRRSTLTLRPGDLIATEADLPDDLRLPVLAMGPEGGDQLPPPPPAGRGAPRPGGVIGAEPTEPGAGEAAGAQGEPVPDKVPARMDVYLVDVTFEPTQAEGLGDRTSQAVAYFSQIDEPGLLRRVASNDRQGVLYQMLARSADEGRNQGQPQESLEAVPGREPRERQTPSETGGGGGGKGGGGGGGG
jgi:hypothetical protein